MRLSTSLFLVPLPLFGDSYIWVGRNAAVYEDSTNTGGQEDKQWTSRDNGTPGDAGAYSCL